MKNLTIYGRCIFANRILFFSTLIAIVSIILTFTDWILFKNKKIDVDIFFWILGPSSFLFAGTLAWICLAQFGLETYHMYNKTSKNLERYQKITDDTDTMSYCGCCGKKLAEEDFKKSHPA